MLTIDTTNGDVDMKDTETFLTAHKATYDTEWTIHNHCYHEEVLPRLCDVLEWFARAKQFKESLRRY